MRRLGYRTLAALAAAGLCAVGSDSLAHADGVNSGHTSMVVYSPASRYPIRGSAAAPLNIIYWAGFKNTTTGQVQKLLRQLLVRYRGKVRLQFMNKFRDGSYYKTEHYAALAAREAFSQGGDRLFWKLHDALCKLRNMYGLSEAQVRQVARSVGVNVRRLVQAVRSGKHDKAVAAERNLAVRLGVPTYNSSVLLLVGKDLLYISRYTRMGYLDILVKRNLKLAQAQLRKGLSSAQVHKKMLEMAKKRYKPWRRYGRRYGYRYGRGSKLSKIRSLPVGLSPSQGPSTAWVTVVAFLDFTDYSSSSAWGYLMAARKKHPRRVRLVFKALPRRYYSYSLGAARAAYAAHVQGKFWKMAKVLFKNRWRLYPSRMKSYAKQAGLDLRRFRKDRRSATISGMVAKDMALARKVGVARAPTVFVNGRRAGRYWNRFVFAQTLKKELKGGLLSRILGGT